MPASHSSTAAVLLLTLSACALDTKLLDNPSDPGTADDTTTSILTGDDAGATDAPTGTTTSEPVDAACAIPDTYFEWFVITNNDPSTWTTAIDETCSVTASDLTPIDGSTPASLALKLDCPQHAATHGEFELVLYSGPLPAVTPQVGDLLDLYFQPQVFDFADSHPQLVFLHSEGVLLYAAAIGPIVDPADAAVVAAKLAPLTVSIEPGPCELVDFEFTPLPFPAESSISTTCEQIARAELHVGSPDDDTLVLGDFAVAEIAVADRTYAVHTTAARRGAPCGELAELTWDGHAIALQSAP